MALGLDRESLDLTLEAIRDFAKDRLPDAVLLDLDARDEFPVKLVRAMCGSELGVQLLFFEEEYGGMGGGSFDVYRVCETLARIDLGVATGVFATFLGSDPIVFGGTPEQKKLWLTRIAEEGLLMAYAATEPEAGSDLAALRTTAERIEEDGRVVATGSTATSSGSATAASPISTPSSPWRPADRAGSWSSAIRRDSPGASLRTSTASGSAIRRRCRSPTCASTPRPWWAASRGRGSFRRRRCSATPG
jgi:alkylation response protein AidB-like acyl-CoA dehydrogenase